MASFLYLMNECLEQGVVNVDSSLLKMKGAGNICYYGNT